MNPTPPRLALWILARRIPRQELEFVLGDLAERFDEQVATRGPGAARRWFWAESLLLALRLWPARMPVANHWASGDSPLAALIRDCRYGLRSLRKAPLFASLVIVTFAIGLGASAAIFSVLDPVLLRGAPYPHADRLLTVWARDKDGSESNIGYLTFRDIQRETRTLGQVAAMSYWTPTLRATDASERLSGQRVTQGFFTTLGVKPELGRDFTAEEDHSATRTVVILSHALWERRFGGDPGILGRTINLGDRAYTVIGVMPRSFESLLAPQAQLWAPLGYELSDPWACRSCQHLRMVARLNDGVSPGAATAELNGISAAMVRANPTDYSGPGMILIPLNDYLTRAVRPVLLATAAAVALLLLIACVNVMNLFLGRAVKRTGEFAVRTALGAAAGPLVRQVLAEAVLLALAGGVLGIGLAYAAVAGLVHLAPPGVPRLDQVAVNLDVLLFTFVMATLAGIAAGLAPAFAALRANLAELLRQGGRSIIGRGSRRVRTILVVAEVALALVLLAGAGLLVRSLGHLLAVDPGFKAEGLVTLELEAAGSRYDSTAAINQFFSTVIDRVSALPGVAGVGAVSQLPLSGDFDSYGIHLESHLNANPADDPSAFRFGVTPGYLRAMKVPLISGRELLASDGENAPPVLLINEAMARRLYPGQDPLGQRVKFGGTDGPWRTIVGVVGNVHHQSLDAGEEFEFYHTTTQGPFPDSRLVLVVRAAGDPGSLVPSIRQAIREIDPAVPIATVSTMTEYIRARAAIRLFARAIFQLFASVALGLAALGLYGVLAGSVTERTREIGIRSALGAPRASLLALVIRHALTLTAIGMAIGFGGAMVLTQLLHSLLFGVTPSDPATFAVVALLLVLVALVAAGVPALRASRVDPAMVLREE
jgi:putative ABC transport system permease protein